MLKNSLGKSGISNPRRTRILDNSILSLVGNRGEIYALVSGFAYDDGFGKYRLNLTAVINTIPADNMGPGAWSTGSIAGVKFPAFDQVFIGSAGNISGTGVTGWFKLVAGGNTYTYSASAESSAQVHTVSFDAILDGKPTWFDANVIIN